MQTGIEARSARDGLPAMLEERLTAEKSDATQRCHSVGQACHTSGPPRKINDRKMDDRKMGRRDFSAFVASLRFSGSPNDRRGATNAEIGATLGEVLFSAFFCPSCFCCSIFHDSGRRAAT